ncbi:MAG: S8 family serine peptidase, partial [Bacteroidia bacterium]|nr:S8 family serine peptidase [Bacteroidia bacterium]
WVKFTDKNGSPYSVSSPTAYLSSRSIARRTNQGIAIDITDIPVNQTYINQVNATGAQVFGRSKWLNAAIVVVNNSTQLTAINSLSCVTTSSPVAKMHKGNTDDLSTPTQQAHRESQITGYNYGNSFTQNNQLGTPCMHENGYRGQGMMIGVLDSGFDNANNNAVFDSLRNENRIIATRDIVMGNSSVYEDHNHGAMVLSCIVGNTPGELIGTAPKASVVLIRTEDVSSEKPIEECNWVVGAEFADSLGVDITTTSLGYTTFDSPYTGHTYSDLDGKTSPMSVAATMAARKGIFVLNAAGNDGNNAWMYIGVPADADSICAVGAVDGSGVHAGFSSVGPTADGRIKPDLSSMGQGSYVCAPNGTFMSGNGTSFATPILAGAVACLWQANPTKTNMQIMQALKSTASQSASPDNNYGWGIPNMCAAHNLMNGTSIGIQTFQNDLQVSIFPNPAKDVMTIQAPLIKEVKMYDVLGKQFDITQNRKTPNQIEIILESALANGVYFLSIKADNAIVTRKFIKE